jgi:ribulose 1,5-bisphosphate synthetase/thiazole synthase
MPDMFVHSLVSTPIVQLWLTCPSSVDVLVIGAGPTGLGAAKRLNQIVLEPHLRSLPSLTECLRMVHHG